MGDAIAKGTRILYSHDDKELIRQIDEVCGGWPVKAKWLTMRHGVDERECYFTDRELRDPMNTSVLSADEYFLSKLSPEAIEKITANARKAIHAEIGAVIRSAALDKITEIGGSHG